MSFNLSWLYTKYAAEELEVPWKSGMSLVDSWDRDVCVSEDKTGRVGEADLEIFGDPLRQSAHVGVDRLKRHGQG